MVDKAVGQKLVKGHDLVVSGERMKGRRRPSPSKHGSIYILNRSLLYYLFVVNILVYHTTNDVKLLSN